MKRSVARTQPSWLGLLDTQYRPALKRFFQRCAPDLHSESDDLVQEVFLRLAVRNGEEIEHPRRYMFKTAENVLADVRRRRIVRKVDSHVELIENIAPYDEASCPERVFISREDISLLEAALAELSEKVRVAFILHRFEELTYREISARMGVSVSSVEKYIMQALVHLANKLERET